MKTSPLDHLEPLLPPGQLWFSLKETASLLRRSPQYVLDCLDSGEILGHTFPPASTRHRKGSPSRARRNCQIPRASLLLFLGRTATYSQQDFAEGLADLLNHCAPQLVHQQGRPSPLARSSMQR